VYGRRSGYPWARGGAPLERSRLPGLVAWVVLLKGANVGGKNTFRPSTLVKKLPELGLTSVGAAGTFVARSGASVGVVRSALRASLPFDPPMMVVRGEEVLRILRANPVGSGRLPPGVRRFVSVAGGRLSKEVPLPIEVPGAENWGVRVLAVDGPFAMGIQRRLGPRLIYPNDVVERAFGVETTTRWWETLESVGRLLGSGTPGSKLAPG
jgi:uncharacterized protein (DUF1697 family)